MLTELPAVERVAMIAMHTSPLAQPGSGDGGGLNVYVLETARRLAARGVGVDVFTRASAPDAPPRVTVSDGFDVHHVAAGPRAPVAKEDLPNLLCAFLLGLERHVEQHLPDANPDVVHAHYWLSGWVGRRLRERWGVPFVQSFHTLARVKNESRTPGDEPEPMLRVVGETHLVEEADRIVVSVCGEARLLHRLHGTSGARLSVVPPGVDHDIFHPGEADPPASAPPGDGPLLLFVGRLQPLKGPDVAVET
ncbi:MAG: glycosyltransferase, partial [Nitriliruptorales bacterium]